MSRHFTLAELTRSATATRHGWDNTPDATARHYLEKLMAYLDRVRDAYGKPIRITSGYRSKKVNEAVGGSTTSQHRLGQAADLQCADLHALMRTIVALGGYDQLIYEHPRRGSVWVHVSVPADGKAPRLEVLDWDGRKYRHLDKYKI